MSTPIRSTPINESPVTDSPGTWRHPKLDEISRRRNATTFTEKNVRRIAYNVVALLALWSIRLLAKLKINPHMCVLEVYPTIPFANKTASRLLSAYI